MGLGLEYRIRLSNRDAISPFLAVARSGRKKIGWKAARLPRATSAVELLPHPKCEPIRLDFSESLTCDGYVKTSFAPERVHIQIVDFLKAMQPYVKSMKVDDECGYWSTGDRKLLRTHRSGFAIAAGEQLSGAADPKIMYGAIVIREDKAGNVIVRVKPGTNIAAKEWAAIARSNRKAKKARASRSGM